MKGIRPLITALSISATLTQVGLIAANSRGQEQEKENKEAARGLQISPVPVKTDNATRNAIGLGSYLVNAAAGCATCHTCPTYSAGAKGKARPINAQNYMAGGVPFAVPASNLALETVALRSPNLTPDPRGLPGGLTFEEFKAAVTGGHRPLGDASSRVSPPSEAAGDEIAVMPWRIYQNFEPGDVEAIYSYLKAIPPARPGSCTGPGQ